MSLPLLREAAECPQDEFDMYQDMLLAETVLNEKFGNIAKGIKEMIVGHVQKAKGHLRSATKQLKSGDKTAAKASLQKAIDEIKQGRKEAEQMDDDNILEQIIIMFIVGVGPVITGCAVAMSIGLGIETIFGVLRIFSQTKMINDPEHRKEVAKKIKGKDALEAYGIARKENMKITRYQLLKAYDNLIKDCETLKSQIK